MYGHLDHALVVAAPEVRVPVLGLHQLRRPTQGALLHQAGNTLVTKVAHDLEVVKIIRSCIETEK